MRMKRRMRGESLEADQDDKTGTDIWLKQFRCSEKGKDEMMAVLKVVLKVVPKGSLGKKKAVVTVVQ